MQRFHETKNNFWGYRHFKNEGVVISRWYSENYLKGNRKKCGAMVSCNGDKGDAVINVKIDRENAESKAS